MFDPDSLTKEICENAECKKIKKQASEELKNKEMELSEKSKECKILLNHKLALEENIESKKRLIRCRTKISETISEIERLSKD